MQLVDPAAGFLGPAHGGFVELMVKGHRVEHVALLCNNEDGQSGARPSFEPNAVDGVTIGRFQRGETGVGRCRGVLQPGGIASNPPRSDHVGRENQGIKSLSADDKFIAVSLDLRDVLVELNRDLMARQVAPERFEKRLGVVGIEIVVEQTVIVAQIKKMKTLHDLGGAQFVRRREESPGEGVEYKPERCGQPGSGGELVETHAVEFLEGLVWIVLEKFTHAPARWIQHHVEKPVELVPAEREYVEDGRGRYVLEAVALAVLREH